MAKEQGWRFKNKDDSTTLAMLMRSVNPATGKAWTEELLSEKSTVSVATLKRFKAGNTGSRTNAQLLLTALGVDTREYRLHIEYTGTERTKPKPFIAPPSMLTANFTTALSLPKRILPPTPPTMFGREEIVSHLCDLLTTHALPMILLHGWPGIGKTALSQAVLWNLDVEKHFGDRRYWVRAERATNAASLLTEVELALGLPANSTEAEVDATLNAQSPCVLGIDNLETPLHADTAKCLALLRRLGANSGVALLASYRGGASDAGMFWQHRISVEELVEQSAMDLFASVAGNPTLAHDERVREIVREVECVPLAVVLLANQARGSALDRFRRRWDDARTRLLSPEENMSRDDNWSVCLRFSLESPRLQACPASLRLVRIMGQLPDGVAENHVDALLPNDTDNAVDALKSVGLISYIETNGRYRMLHPIREYLQSYLPPEDTTDDWDRVENHYIGLLKELGPKTGWDISQGTRMRLLSEINNLSDTLLHALRRASPQSAMTALWQYGQLLLSSNQGNLTPLIEGAKYETELSLCIDSAGCFFHLGAIDFAKSGYDLALAQYKKALQIYESAHDKLGQANCFKSFGDVHFAKSEFDSARIQYEKALGLYESEDDKRGQASCIQSFGDIHREKSELDLGWEQYIKALPIYAGLEDRRGQASCLESIGDIHREKLQLDSAWEHYKSALPLYESVDDKVGQAKCFTAFGKLALREENVIEARRWFLEAIRIHEEVQSWKNLALDLYYISNVPDTPEAQASYRKKADEIWKSLPNTVGYSRYRDTIP